MLGSAKQRAEAAGIEEGVQLADGCRCTGGILGPIRLGVSRSEEGVSEPESRIPCDCLLFYTRRVRNPAG